MRKIPFLKTGRLLLFCLPFLLFQNCTKENLSEDIELNQVDAAVSIDANALDDYATFEGEDGDAIKRSRNHANFKTLNAALACTGLTDVVFSGRKTIYAPTDDAFAKMGLNEKNVCAALDMETLTNILSYHVNEGIITVKERGCIQPLNGDVARLDFRNGRYHINNTKIIASGSQNGKGYLAAVYAIENVLTPPSKTIVETAMAADDFNSLVAAVLAVDPAVAAVLSNKNAIFTVFAPTDQAFADLLKTLGVNSLQGALDKVGKEGLKTILLYHVVNGCATSNDFKNGMMLTTMQGESVTVDLRNKGIKDKTGKTAKFVPRSIDILTANGFLHAIDRVMLPQAIIDAL